MEPEKIKFHKAYPMFSKSTWKGHAAMLLANLIWGCMAPISKNVMLSGQVSPIALSSIRIAGGALVFFIFSYFLPSSIAPKEKIAKNDYAKIFLAGLLMIAFNQGLYITGIGFTSPIDSTVMSTMTPIFTMILAAIFLSMPITLMKIAGIMTGLAGALILVFVSRQASYTASNPMLGDFMCFIAQICASVYYVFFKDIINRYSPWTIMKWMFYSSAAIYIPGTLPWLAEVDFIHLDISIWLSIAYIIFFATFLCYLMLPYAQRMLKPTAVSMYTYFQPAFSAMLSAVLGIAAFGWNKIGATLLIFIGVALVTQSRGAAPVKRE